MVDMKMSATEAKKYSGPVSAGDAPLYPYGLCICLNSESVKKLGLESLPPVGSKLQVTALVEVTAVRQNKEQDGDTNSNCDLQITDMEIAPASKELDAKSLYPNSNHT